MTQAKISQLIHENYQFLKSLSKIKSPKKLHRYLKHANSQQLLAIVEICLNIVCSRFQLTSRQRNRLMPYADFVRRMSRLRSEKGARKFIVQKGSGAPAVFGALLTPILIELAKNLLIKKEN
jgi:hypothetical protein